MRHFVNPDQGGICRLKQGGGRENGGAEGTDYRGAEGAEHRGAEGAEGGRVRENF